MKSTTYVGNDKAEVGVKCEPLGSTFNVDDSGSDSEVSKIDFSGKNMRKIRWKVENMLNTY